MKVLVAYASRYGATKGIAEFIETAALCPEVTFFWFGGRPFGGLTDAVKALAIMNQTGLSRLLVAENDRLVGILTLKDLLAFLSLKVEMEQT